ncbi:MAG: hypothetical protein WCI03_05525 [bacterium]
MPQVNGGTINIDRQLALRDREVSNRNGGSPVRDTDFHLLGWLKTVLLKQAQELEFEWRSDTCGIGLKPRTWVMGIPQLHPLD